MIKSTFTGYYEMSPMREQTLTEPWSCHPTAVCSWEVSVVLESSVSPLDEV